jgi:hypothetical protein
MNYIGCAGILLMVSMYLCVMYENCSKRMLVLLYVYLSNVPLLWSLLEDEAHWTLKEMQLMYVRQAK